MITYNKFLNEVGIISEEEFNEIIASLPEINGFDPHQMSDLYLEDLQNKDVVANLLITHILYDFSYVYAEDVDFEDKCFVLYDVDSLKDLYTIKDLFTNWTISNFEDLEVELRISEEEEKLKEKLIQEISEKATHEQLKEFLKTL